MNKLLLASTALVASTTFAMADVDLTGVAEMGIFGGEDTAGDDIDTQFHTDVDVTFAMTGETDAGLTFGAEVDLDSVVEEDNDGTIGAFAADEAGGDTSVFVSGALGTLTMGDTDGAFDFALTEAIIGGSIQDDQEHAGYNGNSGLDGLYALNAGDSGQIARYDYAFGDVSVAVSAEIDDDPDDGLDSFEFENLTDALENEISEIDSDTVLGVGVKYTGEFGSTSFGAGLGYQRAGNDQVTLFDGDGNVLDSDADGFDAANVEDVDIESNTSEVIGVSLDFAMENGIQGILNYSEYDEDPSLRDSHVGVAVGYEFDAFLVAVNWGRFEFEDGTEADGAAILANYDLGGGAELQGSYAQNELQDGTEYDRYSFGIAMAF